MKDWRKTIKTVLITFVVTVLLIAMSASIVLLKVDFPYKNFLKVISIIESSYVDEYDREAAEENAINAVIEALGDKYAVYYNEENIQDTISLIEGRYIGIGTEVFANMQKNRVEVISAYEDSPAFKAGIKSGDLIKSVDGKEYFAADMADMVIYLKGAGVKNPLEKTLSITIIREEKEITVNLKREEVNIYKVKSEVIDDICYIRYTGFTKTSFNEFKNIIDNIASSVKGIVVDIRDNPGGELNSVIDMCDIFLDDKMVMYSLDKDGDKTEFRAKEGSNKLPLAVIVNSGSASASEVFAGAIKANKRGVIVGERTFGKGVTQSVRYLNPFEVSEGALKLTSYKNYTPDGKWINEGISPDIVVSAPINDSDISKDEAFLAAIKSLKEDK